MNFSEEIASPGQGTTPALLSREPLATEGEATKGPDDEVDFEDLGFGDEDPREFEFALPDPSPDEELWGELRW